jgi:uncharacterized 2Fe-2S/4Fe-4S cluster protein (DUF4445 family)
MDEGKSTNPLVRSLPVQAAAPSLADNTADIDRLKKSAARILAAGDPAGNRFLLVPRSAAGRVAAGFRSSGFKGHALVNMLPGRIEIVDFLPAAPETLPAMALDLGTTDLEAVLVDLLTGSRMAHGHGQNRQVDFGPDILSRIHHAAPPGKEGAGYFEPAGLRELQRSVVASVNDLAADLAVKAGIPRESIRALSVSGNTTMAHLFLGLNPYHICREPYTPLVNEPDPCHAAELGLAISGMAPVWILPSIGSYFGGDLVAGILATGMDEAEETCMLIDVGTNAEVVLGNREWLIACAGAAGPALEGGVARMGMRAVPGAVERVRIDRNAWKLSYTTIDDAQPLGICGSGLIDLAAQLYLAEIIDFRGRFRAGIVPRSAAHEDFLGRRLVPDPEGTYFVVAFREESGSGSPVVLSQTDLDALMRSKAAMYAVLTTLAAQVGIGFGDLQRIYVAGAFGKHIDPGQAISLGMLPDLPHEIYEPVGNSSLLGAEQVVLSGEQRRRCGKIRKKVTYMELNVNQEFMIRFSGARCIPHTDPSLFPSVPRFREGS